MPQSPSERYRNDAQYHNLVDVLESLIVQAKFTPSEVREAAILACINFEMKHTQRPWPFYLESSMRSIEEWRAQHQQQWRFTEVPACEECGRKMMAVYTKADEPYVPSGKWSCITKSCKRYGKVYSG